MNKIPSQLLIVVFLAVGSATAQAPSGTVAGIVTDSSGKPIPGAHIRLTKRDNGLTRTLTTSTQGDYSAAALSPGEYQVTLQAEGFHVEELSVVVETGATTTVNLTLKINEIIESVSVDTASPLIQYESHQVGGLVNRRQIENLPLNGRDFLQEAKLEPGVQPPTRASNNRTFVPALGQPGGNSGRGTRVTVDGGSIMTVGNGGSAMGFSQEVVQEFQVATVNFDLTTGLTNGAAINVTTRSGANNFHGTGLYFFRDHTLAAYPALNRSDTNPDPFFQRRQFGFALGGPIRRDRFFFFGTYERNEQRGVVETTLLASQFAHLNRVTPSPFFNNQLSVRLDAHLSNAHTAFVRYSHDGIRSVGPRTTSPNGYPSSWLRQPGWADQSIFGLTSVFGPALVNDLRFSFFYVNSSVLPVTEQECPGCLGVGAPTITVFSTGLILGEVPTQHTLARRFHLNDYLTLQRSTHRLRFGVDWEYNRGGNSVVADEPATLTLYSPQRARGVIPQLPSAFNSINDILQLPLQTVKVGIGDPRVQQANGSFVRSWNTLRLFLQDTWRPNSQLTINYGLGWSIDRNLNYDLTKPELLAPILGADGLGPTRKLWKNFSPILGAAWSPWRDGKSVIRAGAGFYYDFLFPSYLESERALLSPRGLGRQTFSGTGLVNCLPNIPDVPRGTPLNFVDSPTQFTGANLMSCLPEIRAALIRTLANADRSIQTIQLTKQASGLSPIDVPSWSALHVNVGVQREIARDFVINADFVFRHFDHVGLGLLDLNHFDSVRGPVIPKCITDAQRNDPYALCSNGAINVQTNAGRVNYKGLLVRADKRFRQGFQFLGSWAYSSNTGTSTPGGDLKLPPGFNLDDWLNNRGPLASDTTNIVNLAGVVHLPWNFRMGLNFSYSSTPPFSAFVGGIDFNGDGTTDDLLPGTTLNAFNRGMGRTELENLVTQFNQKYAGTMDARGGTIPRLTLPNEYWFGDNFHSFDLRLSREFVYLERWRFVLIGEVFNLYNAANLSGHSGNLTNSSAFGQPTARFTQVFGSGGPRAFQFGARINF